MKRIANNILKQFEKVTGISTILLCDYLAGRRNMSKQRAIILAEASKRLGYNFTAADWMFHPKKIKTTLINIAHPVPSQDTRKILETVN